jgi:fatty-acyl-CoA synthase
LANRYAHWAQAQRIRRHDTVALFLPNRIEFLAAWYGLIKVGVRAALINNQLAGQALVHCLEICKATHVIVDPETRPAFEACRDRLAQPVREWRLSAGGEGERDLDRALKSASAIRPSRQVREGITAKDVALYIFTSGTTGLPKAARITHMRVQLYMRAFAVATHAGPDDRIHCALPLYHATGGLCAVGPALLTGGCLLLKRRFSASQFWSEVVDERATMFVYIGEFCRYLVNQPEQPDERRHKLKLAFGNGLRPDVWEKMLSRFHIPRILEFYGATEGNVSILNFDGKLGAVGRIPWYVRRRFNVRILRFDVETESLVRGPDGLCIPCQPGETGLTVGRIGTDARTNYTGYADKAASERKVLHDVFEKGDAWFSTGDLMKQDREGYFYFVDRVGDTFRWKGENVSTGEVAERLSEVPGVKEANVYGVSVTGAEGRAGMAALVTGEGFELHALGAHVEQALPAYAQPLFLRLQPEIETTGTLKYRKIDLVSDGFDPDQISDPLLFKAPGQGYVPLSPEVYRQIQNGQVKL